MSPNDGRRGGNIVKPHSTTWGLVPLTSQPRPTSRVGSTNKRAQARYLTRCSSVPEHRLLARRCMNKVSCLSLVSNAILYWNTIKIAETAGPLRAQGEDISDATLAHVSLLPFRHVLPNGTYFIENS